MVGLLRRFSFNYDKTIEDEQEKEWSLRRWQGMGSRYCQPCTNTCARPRRWLALKILERVSSGNSFIETLRKLCEWNDNSYVRDPSKRSSWCTSGENTDKPDRFDDRPLPGTSMKECDSKPSRPCYSSSAADRRDSGRHPQRHAGSLIQLLQSKVRGVATNQGPALSKVWPAWAPLGSSSEVDQAISALGICWTARRVRLQSA